MWISHAFGIWEKHRLRTLLMASQPWILNSIPDITVSDQTTEERGTEPSCFHLQLLLFPGVTYFISLVTPPSTDNPLMSVRRPGIVLDSGLMGADLRGEKELT